MPRMLLKLNMSWPSLAVAFHTWQPRGMAHTDGPQAAWPARLEQGVQPPLVAVQGLMNSPCDELGAAGRLGVLRWKG